MSCQDHDDEAATVPDNLLTTNWVDPVYGDDKITFKRADALPNEGYGISFKENGNLIERSSGWCGTPPLVFSDYQGKWQQEGSLIKITQDNFPGNYNWRIISLTETVLVVTRVLTDQEKDHRELMKLFDDAYALLKNTSCSDANDWRFAGYGAKACGGFQGYIAYPITIDVAVFLQKLEAYTQAEKAYNIKWEIVSDCSIINEPKYIECFNNYPILKY